MNFPDHHPFKSQKAKERYLSLNAEREREWPVVAETRYFGTSYGQTFVRISGPIDAPPLVLLPGINASSLSWMLNIKGLSEVFRTFAVDNIYDSGLSVYSKKLKDSSDFIVWLDELFTALDLEDGINLMGVSYGGWLTCCYALAFPHRLNKIVAISPGATVLPISKQFYARAAFCLFGTPFYKSMFNWLFEDALKKEGERRIFVEQLIDDLIISSQCFRLKRQVFPTVFKDEQLRSMRVPAMVLYGENERMYSPQQAVDRLNRIAPYIQTEIVPDTGHDLLATHSQLVNKKVLSFLKD